MEKLLESGKLGDIIYVTRLCFMKCLVTAVCYPFPVLFIVWSNAVIESSSRIFTIVNIKVVLAYAGTDKQREAQLLILSDSVLPGFKCLTILDIFRINQYLIRKTTTSFLDFKYLNTGSSHGMI